MQLSSVLFNLIQCSVVSSHEISDHDLAVANLTTKRVKSPQRTYQYRDIKNIDLDLFKQNILSSPLLSNPNSTVDDFADQMKTEITSLIIIIHRFVTRK